MAAHVDRMLRVNELVRRELGMLIERDGIAPSGVLLSVTGVRTSTDLRNATVMLSLFGGGPGVRSGVAKAREERRREWQARMAKTLGFKHTPVLCFRFDDSIGDGDRVIELLNSMEESPAPGAGNDPN